MLRRLFLSPSLPVSTLLLLLTATATKPSIGSVNVNIEHKAHAQPRRQAHEMAWRCSGDTNEELIQNMKDSSLFESETVAEAMKRVDRANYVKDGRYAYEDSPQPIGFGATISAPHMHAHACQYLLRWIKPEAHILDVGSGSGYTVAVFHHLLNLPSQLDSNVSTVTPTSTVTAASSETGPSTGVVVGIDHISELVDFSVQNLKKDGLTKALDDGKIIMVTGDGRKGYKDKGPYDIIHVGAAAPHIPSELVDTLKAPGRMFIPVGPDGGLQDVWTVDKDEKGAVTKTRLFGVRYVPLTDQASQRANGF